MNQYKEKIILIGAGLSGSMLAILLARRGFEVEVYERRPDRRKETVDAGRSINLAVSARGIHALTISGVVEKIREIATPMYGRMNHPLEGNPIGTMYSVNPDHWQNSVSRPLLNEILMTEAERVGAKLHFKQRCDAIDIANNEVTLSNLENPDSPQSYTLSAGRIIACDGANSAVRSAMKKSTDFQLEEKRFRVDYKELCIPAGPSGDIQMEKNWLHIWGRDGGNFMMIALPNMDNTFTCTLFMPYEGDKSMQQLDSEPKIADFFQQYFPDALPLMPSLIEDYFHNPTSALGIVMCYPWIVEDKMALVGDACHAVVPFYGQGVNASFEDCIELDRCIESYYPDWDRIFREYQQNRKENADAISMMAQENFEGMSKSGYPGALLRRGIELEMEKRFPEYKSQYELVSFSLVPYSEARKKGIINQDVLSQIVSAIPEVRAEGEEEALRKYETATLIKGVNWEQAKTIFQEVYSKSGFLV